MKYARKLWLMLLILALAALVACGGDATDDGGDTEEEAAPTTAAAEEEEAVDEPVEEEPADTGGEEATPAEEEGGEEEMMSSLNAILLPKFLGILVFDQAYEGALEAATELGLAEGLEFLGPTPENSVAGQIETQPVCAKATKRLPR